MIRAISFPLAGFGFALPARFGRTTLIDGPPGWGWKRDEPDLPIARCPVPASADPAPGWGLDHLVLAAVDLEATVARLEAAGGDVRAYGSTRSGQRAGFVLAGILIEVIVGKSTSLAGLALETAEDLDALADRWRRRGLTVRGPHAAVQPGRRILSAGRVAVMTPRSPDAQPESSHPSGGRSQDVG